MNAIMARGWCPGALRPMETGDGYLVRLRLVNGALSFTLANEIAGLSERFGNGLIDLSARANLQMRGVSANRLEGLWARLAEIDLLDADPAAEAVRNVTPSPLAGFDDSAVLDARPIVAALEARLTQEKALHALPPKFGFLVDGGGVLPLSGIRADVGFHAFWTKEGPRFQARLSGAAAGIVTPEATPDGASALVQAFLDLRADERRMGALVERIGSAAIARRAGLAAAFDVPALPSPVERRDLPGVHIHATGAFVGAAVAFGQLQAQNLRQLAERARVHGAAELRLTPWRAFLAVGLNIGPARALADELSEAGFILDSANPLLVIAACSGRPACGNAHADVRSAALALAPRLVDCRGVLHISGCAKGCAHNARATLTFVASPEGYDVVKNGFARDEPSARSLSVEALAAYLEPQKKGTAA